MEAVILAGGFGTRLRAVVPDLPKPLAPVAGRPFLAILLAELARQGFTRAVLAVGYRHEQIRAEFGECFQGIELAYAVEETPLGTGGAIRQASRLCNGEEMFVLNGDSFVELDYAEMLSRHRAAHAHLSICAVAVPDVGRYGQLVIEDGHVTGFAEKGGSGAGRINAGVYLFAPRLIQGEDLPEAFSFEQDFLTPRLHELHPCAFMANGLFIDIGVPEDYARAEQLFAPSAAK